jgi:DNA modification methylase
MDAPVAKLAKAARGRRVAGRAVTIFDELAASILHARRVRRGPGGTEIRHEADRTIVRGDIPPDLEVRPGQAFLFISRDQSAFTHGLHKYPAKFFPELPRWLVRRYSRRGSRVLDPFTGSGTTNLEALLARRPSMGLDVDPFSRFLARTKVTPIEEGLSSLAALVLLDGSLRYGSSRRKPAPIPEFPYREGWFRDHALDELAYLKREIDELPGRLPSTFAERDRENARGLMLVAFSSIIRAVSNADNNCTRTVVRKRLGKKIPPGFVLDRFRRAVVSAALGMEEFSRACPRRVAVEIPDASDARSIRARASSFSLAVTSPPYCNAVDYPRTHQLEMYWLGIARGHLAPLKRVHVGTEVVSSREYSELHVTGIPEADDAIGRIFEKDPRRAYILYRYLVDMEANLGEVHRVLRPGARYCIAVGNNLMRGVEVESWRYIARLGERSGYELETHFSSEIIRHFIKVPRTERIMRDWVIVLRKRTGAAR